MSPELDLMNQKINDYVNNILSYKISNINLREVHIYREFIFTELCRIQELYSFSSDIIELRLIYLLEFYIINLLICFKQNHKNNIMLPFIRIFYVYCKSNISKYHSFNEVHLEDVQKLMKISFTNLTK